MLLFVPPRVRVPPPFILNALPVMTPLIVVLLFTDKYAPLSVRVPAPKLNAPPARVVAPVMEIALLERVTREAEPLVSVPEVRVSALVPRL